MQNHSRLNKRHSRIFNSKYSSSTNKCIEYRVKSLFVIGKHEDTMKIDRRFNHGKFRPAPFFVILGKAFCLITLALAPLSKLYDLIGRHAGTFAISRAYVNRLPTAPRASFSVRSMSL